MDGKYILTGGEDDLVQVWSMEDRKVVAWGEGHNSWVSGVAFDSYWSSPNSDGTAETVMYRFGSVGQSVPHFYNLIVILFSQISSKFAAKGWHRLPSHAKPSFKEYELLRRNFSDTGCFGFGIQEHIDLGIK